MDTVIEAKNLSMVYRRVQLQGGKLGMVKDLFHRRYTYYEALKNVSLTVEEGEILGYLGPNGAGKSTTIKILTGVMHPTSGSVLVNGISPHKKRVENGRSIALVPGREATCTGICLFMKALNCISGYIIYLYNSIRKICRSLRNCCTFLLFSILLCGS